MCVDRIWIKKLLKNFFFRASLSCCCGCVVVVVGVRGLCVTVVVVSLFSVSIVANIGI